MTPEPAFLGAPCRAADGSDVSDVAGLHAARVVKALEAAEGPALDLEGKDLQVQQLELFTTAICKDLGRWVPLEGSHLEMSH